MKLWVSQRGRVHSLLGQGDPFSIAHGAAIQAGILSGDKCIPDIVVMDINPLTMGIETKDGIMVELISRNTPIPTKKTKPFTTTTDNQDTVGIRVFEGERPKTAHNHFLGQFDLTNIKPAPRGEPGIDVTFDIDVDGILNVRITPEQLYRGE